MDEEFRKRRFKLACVGLAAITVGLFLDKVSDVQYMIGLGTILALYSADVYFKNKKDDCSDKDS